MHHIYHILYNQASDFRGSLVFIVACTRLYNPPFWLVSLSVGNTLLILHLQAAPVQILSQPITSLSLPTSMLRRWPFIRHVFLHSDNNLKGSGTKKSTLTIYRIRKSSCCM